MGNERGEGEVGGVPGWGVVHKEALLRDKNDDDDDDEGLKHQTIKQNVSSFFTICICYKQTHNLNP